MPRQSLIVAVLMIAAGCNRSDTEHLSNIGRKLAAHAKNNTGDLGAKLDLSWAGKREPSLQDKVQDRLRFENTLTDVTFDVQVWDKEVVLKGSVKTAAQRQRAIELAETVAGVERVTETIEVREE
jgi:BON domain